MLTKTIKGKLCDLTNRKQELLEREYTAFQKAIQGGDVNLHSATAQQVLRVKKQKNPRNKQPVKLRNDTIKVEERNTSLSKHWIRIPVYNSEKEKGGSIWCPVTFPQKDWELLKDADIGDSELIGRNGEWFIHLAVKRKTEIQEEYSDVLAVDMGIRWIAVTTFLSDRKTKFYGRKIREIREHYKMLRKKIGKNKVNKGRRVIKRIGNAESRAVEDQLHKISQKIVEEAREKNAIIAIGDLKGIRESGNKDRKFNDKLHKLPSYKLMRFIKYEAEWNGIRVVKVDEQDTSKICNRCGSKNSKRIGQGKFICEDCGLEDNADKNGALNICKRALGKSLVTPLSKAGAVLAQPVTPPQGLKPLPCGKFEERAGNSCRG